MKEYPLNLFSDATIKHRRLFVVGAIMVAAIYLFGVSDKWWCTPDSALYLGLGRSLADGQGYCFNGAADNTVTPGLPLILAGMRMAFGPVYWVPNLFVTLCGLGALWMIYLTLARISDRRTGAMVALATALSYTFHFNSHLIITDAAFTLLFWGIAYSLLRYRHGSALWLVLGALLVALGITIRAPGLTVIGPLGVGLLLDRSAGKSLKKRLLSGIVPLVVLLLTACGFYLLSRLTVETAPLYVARTIGADRPDLVTRLEHLGLSLLKLPTVLSETLLSQEALPFGIIVLLLGIASVKRLWSIGARMLPVTAVVCLVGLGFFAGPRTIRSRYLIPLQPVFIFFALHGLALFLETIYRTRGKVLPVRLLPRAATALVVFIVAINAPRFARNALYYGYLSHTPRYYEVIRSGWFVELHPVAETIRDHAHPDSVTLVKADKLRTFHYLSGRLVAGFPKLKRDDPTDADTLHQHFLDHPEYPVVVIDTQTGSEAFVDRFKMLFEQTSGLELLYDRGGHYRVYRRRAEPSPISQ